ncbi:LysE family translocator [Desulfogranum marinum]|uniref:LysE family translocator n=1 Tax=Desulfogranum marinum TaxID=453220 RepID=UPI001964E94E|nr:LysE family transporter [Desulfogranum marinum]MBM9510982.1 LysE family transporter [Desulfogranum marinum]
MEFSHGLFVITIVHLLAAASPGPDFVMVSQQSLSNGRSSGILCSLGIACGLSVHIIYSALGLAAVIANSVSLLFVIKLLGGSYLMYLGIKGIRSQPKVLEQGEGSRIIYRSPLKTVGKGFLCNVLNPKAPIYFVSLFTIVLSPDIPLRFLAIYGVWIMLLQFLWFSLVALLLSSPPVSRRFNKCGHYVDRVFGGAMVALGLKVITSQTS